MSIFVAAPTGNIGSRLVRHLLDAGADVSVLARHPGKIDAVVRARVTVHQGDLEDAASVRAATEGATAAFVLAPPNYGAADWHAWHRQIGQTLVEALQAHAVERVVFLSSSGAHRDDLGPVTALGKIERMLEAARPHVVSLRPAYFMENFFSSLATIQGQGAMYGAFSPDTKMPLVATQDIAEVAARWLLDDTWTGHHKVGIHGPADRTMAEVAAVISAATGRDVQYVQVPPEAVVKAVKEMGASDSVAANYGEMAGGLAQYGPDVAEEPRTPATTTPTTLEAFVQQQLAPALQGASPAS